jgi:hypothetical protein
MQAVLVLSCRTALKLTFDLMRLAFCAAIRTLNFIEAPHTRFICKAGWSDQSQLHLPAFDVMFAITFQGLQSFGDCITRSDNSLWHFVTISFQRSTVAAFSIMQHMQGNLSADS